MQELNGKAFIRAVTAITDTASLVRTVLEQQPQDESSLSQLTEKTLESHTSDLEDLCEAFGVLQLEISRRSAERIIRRMKAGIDYRELAAAIECLTDTVDDELEISRIFVLNRGVANYFTMPGELFGQEAVQKFPDAAYDMEEAGKCLAAARNTAAAFHLMRTLEHVVRAMCHKVGIADTHRVWGALIADLNKKIDGMAKGKNKTQWAEVSNYRWQVKEVWRNDTMHPNQKYTDDEAREIFHATRVFMRHLATIL